MKRWVLAVIVLAAVLTGAFRLWQWNSNLPADDLVTGLGPPYSPSRDGTQSRPFHAKGRIWVSIESTPSELTSTSTSPLESFSDPADHEHHSTFGVYRVDLTFIDELDLSELLADRHSL